MTSDMPVSVNSVNSANAAGRTWKCRGREIACNRPVIMGILNVTPDSFSDGGQRFERAAAIEAGLRMFDEGADIVDVGGESSRPGAKPVPEAEEIDRVVPVIEAIAGQDGKAVSVDTVKAAVAREALRAGACIVNDISAMTNDAGMAGVGRDFGAGVVLMHMKGTPENMQDDPRYENVVEEVGSYLAERVEAVASAGIGRESMVIDPGIGFGKTLEHNLSLLSGIGKIAQIGPPVLVGLSRKTFLGRLTGRDVKDRLAGSIAGMVLCIRRGASIFRVHDVRESRDAADVAEALLRADCNSFSK